MLLRDRIEALEAALNRNVEVDLGAHDNQHQQDDKVRHSTDERGSSPWPVYSSSAAGRGVHKGAEQKREEVLIKQKIAIVPPVSSPPIIASNNPYASAVNYEKAQQQQQVAIINEPTSPTSPTSALPSSSIAETLGLSHLRAEDSIEYNIYNAFMTNLRICPADLQGPYYYVEHRSFVPNTPGAILREGHDKSGRSIGVANLPYIGINTLGLGDFANRPHEMRWERMAKGAFWTHTKYEFEFGHQERRRFWWIRTNMMVLDDQGDLVLVQEGNESEVLAEYTGKGILKWKKRGALRIRNAEDTFGEGWLLMVLLSWAAVVELARRRARQRRLSALHLL